VCVLMLVRVCVCHCVHGNMENMGNLDKFFLQQRVVFDEMR